MVEMPDGSGSHRYEDMSDEDFVAELRRSLGDRSWTLGQYAELERRGFHVLDDEPDLRAAIQEEYDRLAESVRTALAPVQARVKELADSFGQDIAAKFLPKFDLPPATFGSSLSSFDVAPLEPWTPDYEDLASSIAVQANADVDRAERGLELQQGMLEVLHDVRTETATLNQRDWIDWLGISAAVVAAVAAVVGVILIID